MKGQLIYRAAFKLLSWVCPDDLYEEIEGDLIQRFTRDVISHGQFRASIKLVLNTLHFVRPGIILRHNFSMRISNAIMFIANLKMAVRIIRKQKLFSIINILGLSICMAACMLIFQYAYYETTYDRQHPDFKHTYRLATTLFENNEIRYPSALSGLKDGPTLQARLPEVVTSARLFTNNWFDCTLAHSKNEQLKIFNENRLYYADASLLTVLNFPLIEGRSITALTKPFSIVLSASTAKKYFGDSEPMGKIMHIKGSGEDHDYTVTGVMEDLPNNTHLEIDVLASASSLLETNNYSPFLQPFTYLQLEHRTTPEQIEEKLEMLAKELYPPDGKSLTTFKLQPVADIHLYSKLQDEIKPGGDIQNIIFLLLAAIIVMCIAWINYINLNSSRSIMRGKEVGIRKATGASGKQIALQFLTETFVILLLSVLLAVLMIYLLGDTFLEFTGIRIDHNVRWDLNPAWWWLLGFLLSGLGFAAYFPARIMASFNPATVLKGKQIFTANGLSFKRLALIFQFACTIILTTAVITFNSQFNFMFQQDLHVDINNTMILRNASNVDSTYLRRLTGFKNQLKNLAIIKTLSSSTSVPGQNIRWTGAIANDKSDVSKDCNIQVIDQDFVKTYELKLLAGRDFQTKDFPGKHFGDKLEPVILNLAAARLLGYDRPERVVNNELYWDANKCLVVGVIDDFHQESLKEPIKPTLFTANMGPNLSIKLMSGRGYDRAKTILAVQTAWISYFPNNPFDYSFLKDDFNKQYKSDENMAAAINFFSILAVAISIVGLFALSIFSLNQRTKEVSIRKVLGASASHLFQLLTSEYLQLILIASALSIPVAYWLMSEWLAGFAFHINLTPWLYALPVLLVLVIALLTIGGQTISVIVRNPSDTLKHE